MFDRYVKDRSLYPLQADSRAARRGLRADAEPMPPWAFLLDEHLKFVNAHRGIPPMQHRVTIRTARRDASRQ